jgi:hypothetical protein
MKQIDYIKESVKHIYDNRIKVEELIFKLGKFDERLINHKSKTEHKESVNECLSYLVRPEVLIEKIGNKDKGVFHGTHIDYGDLKSQRIKHKEDMNVFKMWERGDIKGSVIISSMSGGNLNGTPINIINNEIFYGCYYDNKKH